MKTVEQGKAGDTARFFLHNSRLAARLLPYNGRDPSRWYTLPSPAHLRVLDTLLYDHPSCHFTHGDTQGKEVGILLYHLIGDTHRTALDERLGQFFGGSHVKRGEDYLVFPDEAMPSKRSQGRSTSPYMSTASK